jgi:hypothetical protein
VQQITGKIVRVQKEALFKMKTAVLQPVKNAWITKIEVNSATSLDSCVYVLLKTLSPLMLNVILNKGCFAGFSPDSL